MKFYEIFCVILLIVIIQFVSSEEPGCNVVSHRRLAVGKTVEIIGLCQTKTCIENNKLITNSCPLFSAASPGPGYFITQDLKKRFPDCCPFYAAPQKE